MNAERRQTYKETWERSATPREDCTQDATDVEFEMAPEVTDDAGFSSEDERKDDVPPQPQGHGWFRRKLFQRRTGEGGTKDDVLEIDAYSADGLAHWYKESASLPLSLSHSLAHTQV